MSIAFIYPGQGADYTNILRNLPLHQAVEATFKEATEILGHDVYRLDVEHSIGSLVATHLSLFIAGVATTRLLEAEGITAQAAAGLSVGAYSAAAACKSIDFAQGMAMVRKRAELIASGFPAGYAMCVIIGLSEQKVIQIVSQAHSETTPVFVSNINAPKQIIVTGTLEGILKVEASARQQGANKVEKLNVAVPTHCPLYQPAADILQAEFSKIKIVDPNIPYISNVHARKLTTAKDVSQDLAINIAHGVRWYDSITLLSELGVNLFVELAPGNVLTKLNQEIYPQLRTIAFEGSSLEHIKRLAETSQ
ncbi:MAG: acyltransferase domain-containing protein [Candidatus Obscuribacterales bacterium]|jgi:malonate decarboxylase epsilon subunit|nr:acyltransferase domain-containing protein [Candidatus Obscuribacterales bacterium]